MVLRKRLLAVIVLIAVASGGLYAWLLSREKARLRSIPTVTYSPTPRPPRPWRWATEPEWVVHEAVRHLVSWAGLARGEDPAGSTLRVRRTDRDLGSPGTYEVELHAPSGSRTITVRPAAHVWDPLGYAEAARLLIGGQAGAAAGEPVRVVEGLLLAADTASLRKADAALWAEMSRRPRDPRLHEQAALLWASHALRESAGDDLDEEPFLIGVAAHLALARALGAGAGPDARIAGAVLDAWLRRQHEAMSALQGLPAQGAPAAWAAALRLRITEDPRLVTSSPRQSRLEKLEALRTLRNNRSCRAAVQQAKSWRLPLAADWQRSMVWLCSEPELSELSARYLELQAKDAAALLDTQSADVETAMSLAEGAAAENTHQPFRSASVIPLHIRGDASQRRFASAWRLELRGLTRRSVPEEIQAFGLATGGLRERLPQRPLLEMSLDSASRRRSEEYRPRQEFCERLARLIADRPDLVTPEGWRRAVHCQKLSLLQMVETDLWGRRVLTPGTGRLGVGPWLTGPVASGLALEEAHRRAPWNSHLASTILTVNHAENPPPAAVLAAYGPLLEYDISALVGAVYHLHGAADDAERFSERLCTIDAERCCDYATYMLALGRSESAERMWKRALVGSTDLISLSNGLKGYVELLLDRGDTAEALRVARRVADVYSAEGLRTLAYAYERLGRFDEAARQYGLITERYDNKATENRFYVRYHYRQPDERFREERARAMAEVFPNGLQRRSLADFRRDRHRGALLLGARRLDEGLRRLGLRNGDLLVAVDGFAVANDEQFYAILGFTDEQRIALVFLRRDQDYAEVTGPYVRTRYGPPGGGPR